MRTLIAAACLALVSACSDKVVATPPPVVAAAAPVPVPATQPVEAIASPKTEPSTEERFNASLLAEVHGDKYRAATRDALVDLPDPDDRKAVRRFVVSPVASTVLASGETVLVANAEVAGDDGTAQSSHASGGLLNVYLMQRDENGKWQVRKRHENVTQLGSHGKLGSVEWTTVGAGKPGMAITNGGTWQGYTIQNLALFDLTADTMHDLAGPGISIHSDSNGGCNEEEYGKCWSVTGKWSLKEPKSESPYHDIVVAFDGQSTTRDEEKAGQPKLPRVVKKITGTARYAYDGKVYKLVEGANVVPEV